MLCGGVRQVISSSYRDRPRCHAKFGVHYSEVVLLNTDCLRPLYESRKPPGAKDWDPRPGCDLPFSKSELRMSERILHAAGWGRVVRCAPDLSTLTGFRADEFQRGHRQFAAGLSEAIDRASEAPPGGRPRRDRNRTGSWVHALMAADAAAPRSPGDPVETAGGGEIFLASSDGLRVRRSGAWMLVLASRHAVHRFDHDRGACLAATGVPFPDVFVFYRDRFSRLLYQIERRDRPRKPRTQRRWTPPHNPNNVPPPQPVQSREAGFLFPCPRDERPPVGRLLAAMAAGAIIEPATMLRRTGFAAADFELASEQFARASREQPNVGSSL